MTMEEIARLIHRLEQSDITELDVSDDTSSLSLRLAPRRTDPASRTSGLAEAAAPDSSARFVRAPATGRLRLRHPEAAKDPAPAFPRSVVSGEIVAFLEAGGCLRPVLAETDSTIGAPLLAEDSLVGYGTPLFPIL